jgi:hypothetical protein
VCIYLYRIYKINYEFVLQIDPNYRMYHLQFFRVAFVFFFIWIFCLSWQITKMKIPEQFTNDYASFSLFCIVAFSVLCLMPLPIMYSSARWTNAVVIGRCLIAPFPFVNFRDMMLADVLTSIKPPIQYIFVMMCYFMGPD